MSIDEVMKEAIEWMSNPVDDWATTITLAHLRIPRVEMLAYDDIDEAYHFEVKMILDVAMTALVVTTWPGHE